MAVGMVATTERARAVMTERARAVLKVGPTAGMSAVC